LLYYKNTKLKRKEKKEEDSWRLVRYEGVTKALVVSEPIAIFHPGDRKS